MVLWPYGNSLLDLGGRPKIGARLTSVQIECDDRPSACEKPSPEGWEDYSPGWSAATPGELYVQLQRTLKGCEENFGQRCAWPQSKNGNNGPGPDYFFLAL